MIELAVGIYVRDLQTGLWLVVAIKDGRVTLRSKKREKSTNINSFLHDYRCDEGGQRIRRPTMTPND